MKKNVFTPRERQGRNIRYQDCFLQQGMTKNYLPKKLQQQMDFSETSSSSSSSSSESSSDSEEELNTVMKPRIPSKYVGRRTQQQLPREWFTVVDLEGFRPQDVTAKLNPKCRILVIKVKKNNIRQQSEEDVLQEGQTFGKKLVRIIPLPENIHLEELRVKVTSSGELVVKAPFIARGEMQQYQRNISSTWIPLKVTMKDIFATQHQQHTKSCYKNKRCQHGEKKVYPFGLEQMTNEGIVGCEGGLYQHHSTSINTNNTLRTEYIRDEVTGKPTMLVKVNVIGFRPEEVRVRVVESKRVLIVEAIKRSSLTTLEMPMQQQQHQQQGLTMKYFCREFFLPQFLDVTHIAFRVLKSGVLVIKLAMLKNLKETQLGQRRGGVEDLEEQCPRLNRNKWAKIHHCA